LGIDKLRKTKDDKKVDRAGADDKDIEMQDRRSPNLLQYRRS
jgi:hypothetical protein